MQGLPTSLTVAIQDEVLDQEAARVIGDREDRGVEGDFRSLLHGDLATVTPSRCVAREKRSRRSRTWLRKRSEAERRGGGDRRLSFNPISPTTSSTTSRSN